MQAYVKEMNKKHIEEREQLLSVLQDPSFEELCEVASVISDEDKKKRLLELLDKQQKLNLQNSGIFLFILHPSFAGWKLNGGCIQLLYYTISTTCGVRPLFFPLLKC